MHTRNADAQAAQGGIPGWPVAFRAVPHLRIARLCVSPNLSRGSCVLHQHLSQDIHHSRFVRERDYPPRGARSPVGQADESSPGGFQPPFEQRATLGLTSIARATGTVASPERGAPWPHLRPGPACAARRLWRGSVRRSGLSCVYRGFFWWGFTLPRGHSLLLLAGSTTPGPVGFSCNTLILSFLVLRQVPTF